MSEPEEREVEVVARAIVASEAGRDPDATPFGEPMWTYYDVQARAAIRALDAHRAQAGGDDALADALPDTLDAAAVPPESFDLPTLLREAARRLRGEKGPNNA